MKREGTINVAKTKALIISALTAKLICVFVFAYANRWFSHDAAQVFKVSYLQTSTQKFQSCHQYPLTHRYWVIVFYSFFSTADFFFFKIYFYKNIFQEYHQTVK